MTISQGTSELASGRLLFFLTLARAVCAELLVPSARMCRMLRGPAAASVPNTAGNGAHVTGVRIGHREVCHLS